MDGPIATASLQDAPVEYMEFSEKTTEEIERHKQLLAGLELQKRRREIAVPTSDVLVKARLIELEEPIILFGEGKPERRERLRQILSERGITEAMPTTVRRTLQPTTEVQTEATPGPPELKEARLKLVTSSLEHAKKRLADRAKVVEHMENNWELHEKGFLKIERELGNFSESSSTIGDSRPLSSVSYNFDGTQIATSSWSGDSKIWDLSTCTCVKKLMGHTQRVQTVLFHPREQQPGAVSLASCGADNKVLLWSLDSEKPVQTLNGHVDRVNKVVFHPHYQWLASTSFDRTWCLWDLETGKELLIQGGNSRAVYALAFHPDGALVGSGGMDSIGRIWDMRNGRAIWNMRGHIKHILSMDFSPNGYQVATGSADGSVRIWDLRKRKVAKVIPAHNSVISTVKYQPHYGNYLTTASFDGKIKLWSTKNYSLMKTLPGHEDKISCMDISPARNIQVKMEVEDDENSPMAGYVAPVQLVTSSFDRTWKLWSPDILSSI
eukprot:TRINITY_DN14302_c0_g1_i1.p1 TRINITY_DN14302_c0_g1~~TRINITY_DN14302_c0_g1_i1.p1  ORF type:complete len:519 (+),score=107.06 TRINITY_DN14302_c0_g1_i1:75-1559(+)